MEHLIPKDLCTRCGACFAADSEGHLRKDADGYPFLSTSSSHEKSRLLKVCAGENWNYREILDFVKGSDYEYDPLSADKGVVLKLGIAYSKNSDYLLNGQSGGVSTTIFLSLLERGIIKNVGAVKRPLSSTNKSTFASQPFIASTREEILKASGSKYTVCSTLELIPKLESLDEPYALSLLPCQTVGYHKLRMETALGSTSHCKLVIGPFCGFNMDANMGFELAQSLGINPLEVKSFQNRSGRFPGITTFETNDGTIIQLDRTAHRPLYRMYSPIRCFTCTDFTNELADISIADCWITEGRDYKYPNGAAWVLVRTQQGLEALDTAIEADLLQFYEMPLDANDTGWHESIMHRKVRTYGRISEFRKLGLSVPTFDYPVSTLSPAIIKSNYTDLFFIRLFRHRLARKLFLYVWIKLYRRSGYPFANKILSYLGSRVFTHRMDNDPPFKVFLSITSILLLHLKLAIMKRIKLFCGSLKSLSRLH
jgi:coenzyme F420 hydrogenase subunit beta